MTFDRRLANIRTSVALDIYCPSFESLIKKTLHEMHEDYRCFLSNAPTAHHNIT